MFLFTVLMVLSTLLFMVGRHLGIRSNLATLRIDIAEYVFAKSFSMVLLVCAFYSLHLP